MKYISGPETMNQLLVELEDCWKTSMPCRTFGEFLHVVEAYMEQREMADRLEDASDEGLIEALREIRAMDEEWSG